jgi:hypothetical protein
MKASMADVEHSLKGIDFPKVRTKLLVMLRVRMQVTR